MEFKSRVLKFSFNGEMCSLNYPTVIKMKMYTDSLNGSSDSITPTLDFLVSLGLKKEIAEQLELEHLNKIIETLTDDKKK